MLIILEQVIILYIFLFIGWLFGKTKKDSASQIGIISFILINLCMPSKVFLSFSTNFTVSYLKETYITVLMAIFIFVFLWFATYFIVKPFSKDSYQQNVYRYSLNTSNCGYMGYTLVENTLGAQSLTSLIFFCIPYEIYTSTWGYSVLTGNAKNFKKLINPMTISILLGIIVGLLGFPVPDILGSVISSSSSCVGPLAMLLTGFTLSTFSLKELLLDKKSYLFTAIRLIGIPLIIFGLCELVTLVIDLPYSAYSSSIIFASMPCGLGTIIFARLAGKDCNTGARLIFLSHLFSCITIPIWLSFIS